MENIKAELTGILVLLVVALFVVGLLYLSGWSI